MQHNVNEYEFIRVLSIDVVRLSKHEHSIYIHIYPSRHFALCSMIIHRLNNVIALI
jgi:hypothetical protein